MMNYFEFFEIPVSFQPDEAQLKRSFYVNSKKYHPDFYTLESEEKQMEVLELSTLNNEAYKTLSDFDKRMKYILDLKGALAEEGKNQIPQDFLMDMMDINENLMELEFDFDEKKYQQVKAELQAMEASMLAEVQPHLESYDDNAANETELNAIKNYYLKKRYILRIQENLNKFATL
ncbi:MAG: iron-sulfur cluster co-chaperone HscB C-terminal domain-containing protein [Bacteroidota bacterium]